MPILLRLANICGGTKALANIGALLRVAVSQIYGAGRGPLVYLDGCPCSASAVSAAGSASAAQPASPRCFCRRQRSAQLPPVGGSKPKTAPSDCGLGGAFSFYQPKSQPRFCGLGRSPRHIPPEGGMPRSGRGDSAQRAVGGFRSKIKNPRSRKERGFFCYRHGYI